MQKMASFSSISIQANGSASLSLSASSSHHHHHHVLSEDESPIASPTVAATAPLKGGDGYDRLLEYRCGRYLYHHAQATFLPVPDMPHDFAATLHTVAGSRNIKGAATQRGRAGAPSRRRMWSRWFRLCRAQQHATVPHGWGPSHTSRCAAPPAAPSPSTRRPAAGRL